MKKENYFKIILTSLIFALFIQINLFSQSEITSLNCYNFATCFDKGYYSKDPETRIEYYSKALLLWKYSDGIKNKSTAYTNRGIINLVLGKKNEGISDLNKSTENYIAKINEDPHDSSLYNSRGWAYLWLDECEKAKSDFEKAIEIDKNYPIPYDNLGIYWWHCKKNKNKALDYFKKAFQKGFDRWDELYDETSDGHFIKDLNKTPEFKKLVKKYKNKQDGNQ
jgi:tetratricopeptide (TPR) repeat protein